VPQASEQSNPSNGLRAKGPYTSLPKRIRREDTIAAKESDPPPDLKPVEIPSATSYFVTAGNSVTETTTRYAQDGPLP
jgi:hypothetical protein